ncbi:hypothetical protein BO70DRAFT_168638 [Aspergillus heteromorphus CBS 117.55]|uniref:Uncharacterized protein n=1 Tax=Aspergillus heteromorphus CBS 117.55 TaxID=1448321 RepID=A0A317V0Q2_9EURO|nr:uncharacterized protein BO70DRAFT_168638 [Aspergillus heteromorphus CBS 117.55]PWY67546.1 hypothetical protein BO70DRAFT_168638 [Aspergillus heteromorphus CBS 117.55]
MKGQTPHHVARTRAIYWYEIMNASYEDGRWKMEDGRWKMVVVNPMTAVGPAALRWRRLSFPLSFFLPLVFFPSTLFFSTPRKIVAIHSSSYLPCHSSSKHSSCSLQQSSPAYPSLSLPGQPAPSSPSTTSRPPPLTGLAISLSNPRIHRPVLSRKPLHFSSP